MWLQLAQLAAFIIFYAGFGDIMFNRREENASAVLFLSDNAVVKELLHTEFEAMLEGFTPEREWAGRDANAVYLELDADLKIRAAVFFTVSFDEEGWVESSWNIPLINLARTAKYGLDLGSGAIRLATQAQCPDDSYQLQLWTPNLAPGSPIIAAILEAIAVNRLGLSRRDAMMAPTLAPPTAVSALPAGMEHQFAQLMHAQMQGANDVANTMAQMEQLKSEYEQKIHQLQAQLSEYVRQFEGARSQLDQLERELNNKEQVLVSKEQKLAELREYYELKLEKTKGAESDHIRALRQYYEDEASQQIASAESEYKELLNWREVELLYRAEREAQLHEEIIKLRQANTELELTGGEDLLHKLSQKGISFMTYQVGLGHISIPVDDVGLYLTNPIGFVASYCNVSQTIYLDWLAHFHAPVCRVQLAGGDFCGADVPRVDTPEFYLPGASDCCEKHRNRA